MNGKDLAITFYHQLKDIECVEKVSLKCLSRDSNPDDIGLELHRDTTCSSSSCYITR
ncbi:hypothetical protein J6590_039636 [Homalodisca vitripennis]|nr:hypothetical protein J6590_039636 [Homalodisca vitripennis]